MMGTITADLRNEDAKRSAREEKPGLPLPTERHYLARIVERKDLSEDLWLIRVDPGGPFRFKAGQYATLGVEHENQRIERAYSVVSSPYEEGTLEFFIELVPHGALTPLLYKLNAGDTMLCRKIAKGRFTLDLRSGRTNHLLLATVTGIAPFVSYVRTLYRDWKSGDSAMPGPHKVFCVHGSSRSWEFGYRDELERIATEVPWFKYVPTISRPWEDAGWKGQTGRADDLIRKYADQWGLRPDTTTAYLCGHPSMCENGLQILARAGWQKGSIFEEVYFVPGKEAEAE
jgi:ferredoxin/flavodoxin---NADP+ reductase